ncbi:MAG: SIMPL domain-containing protein [Longimicrobiales bacterium]
MKRLLFALILAAPVSASAQQVAPEQPRTLSISASATVERAPDQAVLLLAVESEAPTAKVAGSSNAAKMDRMVAALKALGIPATQIRTVSYELQPQYAQENNREPRIVAYRAVNQVQVVLDAIDRVGPTIDTALGAGANRVSNLTFGLKDASSARLEALKKAIERAKQEADVVARAAGQTLGVPQAINVDGYNPQPPRPVMYMRDAAMSKAESTPVEGGTLQIGASVNIVYRIQ